MGLTWPSRLIPLVRRAVGAAALLAQVLMVYAPAGELCESPASLPSARAGMMTLATAVVMPADHRGKPHNPATCPACIAQSLHAQLTRAAGVPALSSDSRMPVDVHGTFLVVRGLPATHRSRAPPVRS